MSEKIKMDLNGVQKTLLLPLWGRATETQKKKPLLIDKTAVEIINKIDYDFSVIAKNINPITRYAWITRSLHTDRIIKHFLNKHPKATIVNIGCGLDTTFDRIDNGLLSWYDLDLPDVIRLRSDFIQESDRKKFIPCSFLDYTWLNQLMIKDNILFVSAGVLYYFEENQIKEFFIKLANSFPGSEIYFDIASPLGIKLSNKKVIEAGGMDKGLILKWGIKNAKNIELWDNRFKIISAYPIYKYMKKGIDFRLKFGTLISDYLKIMSMVHLRF